MPTAKPLVPWLGGKRKLMPIILQHTPEHHTYLSAFFGGGADLFLKPRSKVEVVNDKNRELINLYRMVREHPEYLIQQTQSYIPSRADFERLRDTDPGALTEIQRAVRMLYIVKLCFGSKVTSPTYGPYVFQKPKYNRAALQADIDGANERLNQVSVETMGYAEFIGKYAKKSRHRIHLFLDPPYYGGEKDYGKGLFDRSDFEVIRDLCRSLPDNVTFLLTINDVPAIRELFAEFRIVPVESAYTVSASGQVTGKQLLVMNY